MRTTKFRFWDIAKKEMITWEDIHKEHSYHYISEDEGIVIPMQFTGLKDKNGKEIYEGDILKNPKGEIGKVIWFEAGFHLECKRKNGDLFMIPLTAGFLGNKEIIGNIHDNPELLK